MSLAPVNAALDDLLAGDAAQAVALKGEWGRGKSYLWRTYLASRGAQLARSETYSYVSLFGLDSLSAVKEAIFANAESFKDKATALDAAVPRKLFGLRERRASNSAPETASFTVQPTRSQGSLALRLATEE